MHDSRPSLRRFENLDLEIRTHVDATARLKLSARMNHRLVLVVAEWLEEKQLGRCAGVASAKQSRMKHARRVQDDRVAGGNQLDEIAKRPVLDRRPSRDAPPSAGSHRVARPVPVLSDRAGDESRSDRFGFRQRSKEGRLRRPARRHRESEMSIRLRGRHAAARRALQKSVLNEERLVHFLDRSRIFADRRGDRTSRRPDRRRTSR